MRVTTIDSYDCEPGVLIEWTLTTTTAAVDSTIPPSFNQSFHLDTAIHTATETDTAETASVWIAASFDVDGHIDVEALGWAFHEFIARHGTLRSGFDRLDSGLRRFTHLATDIALETDTGTAFDDSTALRSHLWGRLNTVCNPQTFPAYLMAAVDRSSRSTVVCGFDHSNVDGYSISIAAQEILHLYEFFCDRENLQLPRTGDFVDYCAEEAAEKPIPADDPRLQAWSQFIDTCGGTTPSFPLDLGVEIGADIPAQATSILPMLNASDTEAFERACRAHGAGMFTALTSALGTAVASAGGPRRLPLLFPLHTRTDPQWERAVGWFTTNAPMTVTVEADFESTLRATHQSFRRALPLSSIVIPRVIEALGDRFRRVRQDVFMVSYIDYLRLPGNPRDDYSNAHHISNVTVADDAQFWFSRTSHGLSLRARYPDTALARRVMHGFFDELRTLLTHVASTRSSLTTS